MNTRYICNGDMCNGGKLIIQDEDSPCHLASELSRETVKELTGTQPQEFAKVSINFQKCSLSGQCSKKVLSGCSLAKDNIFAIERLIKMEERGGAKHFLVTPV